MGKEHDGAYAKVNATDETSTVKRPFIARLNRNSIKKESDSFIFLGEVFFFCGGVIRFVL